MSRPLGGLVNFIGSENSVAAGQAPRGIYHQAYHYDDSCTYIKNIYLDPDLRKGASVITITSSFGEPINNISLDHLSYKFTRSNSSGYFAVISFDLSLFLYSPSNILQACCDISKNVFNRSQIRCLDLSEDGQYVYFSNSDKITCLNHKLEAIGSWKVPRLDLRYVAPPKEALAVLGLKGNPNNDEIKSAYRKHLLMVHPDKNPNDPFAADKTRKVISAYEALTSEQYRDENMHFHNEIQELFSFHLAGEDRGPNHSISGQRTYK